MKEMKKIHKYVILASVSILTICLFFGIQDSNVDTKYTMPIENGDFNLYTSDGDETIPEDDPPDEGDPISIELIDTETIFDTNTSAEDQSKISWGYSEWREQIIFQIYNVTEAELDDSILNNETAQKNLHISTIMAWGQYNGSLSEEELLNLYNQMEHHTVRFDGSGYYESSDERLYLKTTISVRSIAWLLQWHEARSLDIYFCSDKSSGKWYNWILYPIWPIYTHMKHHSLKWKDNNRWDTSFTKRSVYSDILTGSKENHLYVKFKVNCIYNGIPYTINRYYYTHLVDDDTHGPTIYTFYQGSYTDGNPGIVYATGYDASGGHWTSPIVYSVANSLTTHSYTFSAVDHDNDRPGDASSSSKTISIPIHDDDTTAPVIGISYSGSKTDDDPGKWSVSVSDSQSGVAQIVVVIDGIIRGSTAGDYTVSNVVGSHTISVYAINNDRDRGSVDQEDDTKTNTVTIAETPPTDPIVDAGPDQTINEGSTASFVGSFEDTGVGEIHEYQWDFGDGTVINFPGTLTPTHKYLDDGAYTVTLTVIDNDEGVGTDSLVVTVNNVDPTAVAGFDLTVNEEVPFTLLGSFTDPGLLDTHTYEWDFENGPIIPDTLTPTHTYDDPGVYLVTLRVWDDDGGYGSDTLTITVLDTIPPVTSIAFTPYYEDEFGNIYITSDTFFTLNVIEEFSGIAWTKYTINGEEEFDYTAPFNIIGSDGTYVITFNSADNSDNVEVIDEDNEITVMLVSLDVNSYLTDSDFKPVTYFDFIFRKDKSLGFTLVATNPGQFYYHIEVLNTWLTTIDTLIIDANLPQEFVTQGATPIHVYQDGTDITNLCDIDGTTVIVSNVPSGSLIYIKIHMDLGLKGDSFESLDAFILETYSFDTTISGEGILAGTYGSSSFLIGHQKKSTGICGFVTDINGNPRSEVVVSLYSENGVLATAITDEDGFYYFINLDLLTYYLKIVPEENPIIVMEVTVKKDDFVEANFSY